MRLVLFVGLLAVLGCGGQDRPTEKRPAQPVPQAVAAQPEQVELQDAIRRGLITAMAHGGGLSHARIEVTLKGVAPLTVEVRATTLLGSKQVGVQNMVVTKSATITVKPGEPSQSLTVAVACVNMPDAAPDHSNELIIQPLPSRASKWSDLKKLLSSPHFQELDSVPQQFAVWTVTDNPGSREKYQGITVTVVRPNSLPLPGGPRAQHPDFEQIKLLFDKVGIDKSRYAVFRAPQRPVEERSNERVKQAKTLEIEAKADAFRRGKAAGKPPTEAELAEIKTLEAAADAVSTAESRFMNALHERQTTEASTYAESKAKDGLEDKAVEVVERRVGPLLKAETLARTEAEAKYQRWLSLATGWIKAHRAKDEAEAFAKMWSELAESP